MKRRGCTLSRSSAETTRCAAQQVGAPVCLGTAFGRGGCEDDQLGVRVDGRKLAFGITQIDGYRHEGAGQQFGASAPSGYLVPGGDQAKPCLGAEVPGTEDQDLHFLVGRTPARAMASV